MRLLIDLGELEERGSRWGLAPHATPGEWPATLADAVILNTREVIKRLPDSAQLARYFKATAVLGEGFEYEAQVLYLLECFETDHASRQV